MKSYNNENKKILIIKLGAIGDSIFATIIATAIKEAHPHWQVDYLTHETLIPLLENCPHIDNFIPWKQNIKKNIQIFDLASKFRREHYNYIFNLSVNIRNIILSLISLPDMVVAKKEFNKSWVENFYLTAKSVIPDLNLPSRLYLNTAPDAVKKIHNITDNYPRPFFVLLPGGSSDYTRQGRLWNIDKWSKLSNILIQKFGGTVFLCGNTKEAEYHNKIKGNNIIILTGKYTLSETSTFLSFVDLVIAGDTGPLHIASAHNVKTLAILGSTSPDKIKPYGLNGYFIEPKTKCRYCWKKKCKYLKPGKKYAPCIESITPNDVIDKIKKEQIIINVGELKSID